MQSVFTGLGITLANVSLYIFQQTHWLQQTSEAAFRIGHSVRFILVRSARIGLVLCYRFINGRTRAQPWKKLAAIKAQPSGPAHAVKDIVVLPKAKCRPPLWHLAILAYLPWYVPSSTGNIFPTVSSVNPCLGFDR